MHGGTISYYDRGIANILRLRNMKAVPTTRFHDGHELIKVFFQSRTMQPIYCFVLVHKEGIKNRHGSAIRNHVEVRNKSTEDTNILTFTAEAKVCFVSRMFDQWRRHSAKKENMVCFRKALTYFFLGSNSLKVLRWFLETTRCIGKWPQRLSVFTYLVSLSVYLKSSRQILPLAPIGLSYTARFEQPKMANHAKVPKF